MSQLGLEQWGREDERHSSNLHRFDLVTVHELPQKLDRITRMYFYDFKSMNNKRYFVTCKHSQKSEQETSRAKRRTGCKAADPSGEPGLMISLIS